MSSGSGSGSASSNQAVQAREKTIKTDKATITYRKEVRGDGSVSRTVTKTPAP
jgi:hypothetical protein